MQITCAPVAGDHRFSKYIQDVSGNLRCCQPKIYCSMQRVRATDRHEYSGLVFPVCHVFSDLFRLYSVFI